MSYYWGVLVGSYLIIGGVAIGADIRWWTPISWGAFVAAIEGVARLVRRARKKRQSPATPLPAHLAPPTHSTPEEGRDETTT